MLLDNKMARTDNLHLFFHKDFDGICSAAVFLAYISRADIHYGFTPELISVDYDLKRSWPTTHLPKPSAIVDFLYHPDADWWFDHHPTSFLSAEWEASFKADERHVWDTSYKSCPGLILDSLREGALKTELSGFFRDHILWSEIIDTAEYASPKQVVEAAEPALRINLSLASDNGPEYLTFLIGRLQNKPLEEVADLGEVVLRYEKAMSWQKDAISHMEKVAEVKNEVAFFDLTSRDDLFHRYAAYYLWPNTRFIVAVYKNDRGFRITVGSNPWLAFKGPDLGALCERYGGGGHAQVGGIASSAKGQAFRTGLEIARKLRGELPYTEQLPFRQQVLRQQH